MVGYRASKGRKALGGERIPEIRSLVQRSPLKKKRKTVHCHVKQYILNSHKGVGRSRGKKEVEIDDVIGAHDQ